MNCTLTQAVVCSKGIKSPTRGDCRACSLTNYGRNCYNDPIPSTEAGLDAYRQTAILFVARPEPTGTELDAVRMYHNGTRINNPDCQCDRCVAERDSIATADSVMDVL